MDIERLLSQLTDQEKIRLLSGVGDWHTYDCHGKIPSVMMTDGPHGIRKLEKEKVGDIEASNPATCFPTASAMACSWNPNLLYEMGQAIAREAKKEKISMVLGCGINIKRSPLCGRNFEYFSEDPYLTGKLATNYIKGVQSLGIGTSLKHYAVNSQETRRMTSNSQVDERTLREIYLSAFEETIKEAQPTSVMASYNRVNGTFSTRNSKLLSEILRDEWNYKGAVISDWCATNDVVSCMKNGLTLEMPDSQGYHTKVLTKAYEQKIISTEELNIWARKVLKTIVALHENVEEHYSVDMESQNEIARKLENDSAVLLKNNGLLPIPKKKKLIMVGELAEHMRFQGGGSSHIQPTRLTSAVEAIQEKGYDVRYVQGYRNDVSTPDEQLVQETLQCIKSEYTKEDTVILFFIGLTDQYEGEGYDRKDFDLPANQVELLQQISEIADAEHIVGISFGGAPMDFRFEQNTGALLHMYLGGQAVGQSVADLISGEVNPSGKLAETIPFAVHDTPAWRYFAPSHDDVEYREGIFVGYRYYETFGVPVKYPFGFGLSYTTFAYSDLTVPECYETGELTVTCKVKNTGTVAGAETAQLYVLPESNMCIRSAIELRGFQKIMLQPGEEKEVAIKLNERSFSVFNVQKKQFTVIGGTYTIGVGSSVKNLFCKSTLVVQGEDYFRDEKKLFPDYFKEQPHGMQICDQQFYELLGGEPQHDKDKRRGQFTVYDSYGDVSRASLFGRIVRGFVNIAMKMMFRGNDDFDPALKMVKMGVEEGNLESLIAGSGGIASPKLIDMLVLNANRQYGKAFVRLFKK